MSTALQMTLAAFRDAAPRYHYQRAMYAAAVVLALCGVFHLVVLAVDGGPWLGPVSWRKPIVFGFSFAASTATFGWVQGLLPPHRLLGWLTTSMIGAASLVEVALITMQRWRGVPSHFNTETTVDRGVFDAMAVSVGLVALGMLVLAGWCAARLRGQTPAAVAVVVGIALMLLGSWIGSDMVARGTEITDITGAVPQSSILVGAEGSARLAHATGLHGLQVLAVLSLLLGRTSLPARTSTRVMLAGATAYAGLTALVVAQAYAGRGPFDLTPPTAVATLGCLAVLGAVFAVALAHPRGLVDPAPSSVSLP